MSFEGELKSHYAEVRNRLRPPVASLRFVPKPTPASPPSEPVVKLSQLSTRKIETPRHLSIHGVLRWVATEEGVQVADLLCFQRTRRFVIPRFVFYYLAYHGKHYTTSQIARVAHRDHTTVIYGIGRLQHFRDLDPELDERVKGYEAHLDYISTNHVDCGDKRLLCGHCPLRMP